MQRTTFLLVACLVVALSLLSGVQSASEVHLTWYDQIDVNSLAWCGQNVVFMLTEKQGLYRSNDEGQTWARQFQNINSTIVQMHQDPVDDNKIIFLLDGLRGGWATADAGLTYSVISLPFQADRVEYHPTEPEWLIAGECGVQFCSFYASQNYAKSFTRIGTGLFADWSRLPNSGPTTTVFLVDTNLNFGYTTDFGKSFTVVFKYSFGFVYTTNHLFVGQIVNYIDSTLLVSSQATTQASSYQEAQFPFGDDLPVNIYTLLDDTTGAEWLGLAYTDTWGTIYTSGAQGVKYTTSLKHVFHIYGYYDFAVFQGLEGIYIANNVVNYEQTNTGTIPIRTTLITFDNGGEWRKLVPPTVNSKGEPISCTGTCSLHLNGIHDWALSNLGPFYSSPNAIGLLIATGNIGESLSGHPSDSNVYFSRDAGLTWNELLQGPHIYEFGDHGGIIVFADTSKATNQLIYTLDEGLTMQYVTLDKEVEVENIIVEPSGTARKFILYGKGIVVGVDFTDIQPRTCGDVDYEPWTPTDGRANGQTCQLGRNVTYLRRIRTANCFNERQTEHELSTINCSCAYEDYECDFGYEEETLNGVRQCVVNTVNPPADPPLDCPEGNTYLKSSGYRIVAGDTCVDPLPIYQPLAKKCPASKGEGGKSNGGLIAVVVIFITVAVIGIAGFFIYRNEAWREKFLSIVGKVLPINQGPSYSRLGRQALNNDEEFGIGGEQDLDDDDVEEDAPELQDTDIQRATSEKRDEFNPRM